MRYTESCRQAVEVYMDGISAYEVKKVELEKRKKSAARNTSVNFQRFAAPIRDCIRSL